MKFAGPDYLPTRDHKRLASQIESIRLCMKEGGWWTLKQISDIVKAPTSSVSSQLSNLRAVENGGYVVERKSLGKGLNVYRLIDPPRDILYLSQQVERRRLILNEMDARRAKAEIELKKALDLLESARRSDGAPQQASLFEVEHDCS